MIQDRDLWAWKLSNTKAFTAYLGLLNQKGPKAVEEWIELYDFCENMGYQEIVDMGETLLKKHDQEVAKLVTKAHDLLLPPRTDEQSSYIIKAVNCPAQYSSDVGNILASQEGASFGATYCIESRDVVRVSLRGNGSVNVAEIAERFGGGGHANAAGFTISAEWLFRNLI
jgi:oligoribonuclease NrnB/cAMP/cGMP phosphodiesterase (DHH superfamily)